ncbi:MAG: hypothetical protein RI955_944 [Bacteroidota bacterium]|jgi:hypothetical protein
MRNKPFTLILILLLVLSFQSVFSQRQTRISKVYLKDRNVLLGEVNKLNDSTVELTTRNDETRLIKSMDIDSIVKKDVVRYDKPSAPAVRFIISSQLAAGSLMRTNSNPLGRSEPIQTVNFGIGICFDNNVALSLLPSVEGLQDKKYFVVYPDIKFFLGDNKNTVRGFFELNYFNNNFFGLSQSGYSSNIIGGLAIGDEIFKFTIAPSFEFIDGYQFFKVGIGFCIIP